MMDFPFMPREPEPRVGIFWSYQNSLFHAEYAPLSQGMISPISVDYKIGHYAAWFLMDKKGILDCLPAVCRSEYDTIPRGRVVYLFKKQRFVIYHGDDFSPRELEEVKSVFCLPGEWTIDARDMHYNPLPQDFKF